MLVHVLGLHGCPRRSWATKGWHTLLRDPQECQGKACLQKLPKKPAWAWTVSSFGQSLCGDCYPLNDVFCQFFFVVLFFFLNIVSSLLKNIVKGIAKST